MRARGRTILQSVMDSVAGTVIGQFERRVAALEAHITDLEDRLNDRGVFSGDPASRPCTDSCCPGLGRIGECRSHEHAEYDVHAGINDFHGGIDA